METGFQKWFLGFYNFIFFLNEIIFLVLEMTQTEIGNILALFWHKTVVKRPLLRRLGHGVTE
ncbi:hypothetical protein [Bartonella tribocorum]|uniref:hypothetical protein n=1 Tax=Bartonella tribocorum TaxID=85701 RepID=UPI0002FB7168|nr:hypothetical protein [Bartonella tribocorum]